MHKEWCGAIKILVFVYSWRKQPVHWILVGRVVVIQQRTNVYVGFNVVYKKSIAKLKRKNCNCLDSANQCG